MKTTKPSTFTASVTTNGRITIPDNIRDIWNIKDGDYVECQLLHVEKPVEKEAA